jgi:polysaccharide chain length determinant protein (PEP-CTERM system associated)
VVAASDFMAAQVEEAGLALETKDKALRLFKERHMGSLPDQLPANLATLQRLQLEHQTVTESLRAARDRQVVVEKNLADQVRVSSSAGTDPVSELPQLQSELATLRAKYTDEHPEVQALKARIDRLSKALSSTEPAERSSLSDPAVVAARQQVQQVQLEVSNLATQRDDLARQIAELQARVDRVPANEQELQNLTREYGQLKLNYDTLLQRRLAAGMAEKVEKRWRGEHFRILDPAFLPERPFYPNRMLFLLAGLLGGLGLGIGLAFGAEALDHSIKSVEELAALVGYPVLASVPHFDALPDEEGGRGLFSRG